ncbi:MAG: hypothetical protein H6643_02140 [Caldilineaceae bacterium]|nr:hypothetical protein [Caldilineaceae bacterium]
MLAQQENARWRRRAGQSHLNYCSNNADHQEDGRRMTEIRIISVLMMSRKMKVLPQKLITWRGQAAMLLISSVMIVAATVTQRPVTQMNQEIEALGQLGVVLPRPDGLRSSLRGR